MRDVYCGGRGGSGAFYAYKYHAKISCEYSAINRSLRCRDISRIQKISDAHAIKNRGLKTKTNTIYLYKK